MKVTKDIRIELNEYDDSNRIGIVYYDNNTQKNINSFVFYSNAVDENGLTRMEKSNLFYISNIDVKKNSDLYFSVLNDNFISRAKNFHIHLGNTSEDCFVVHKEDTYTKIQKSINNEDLNGIELLSEKELLEADFDKYFYLDDGIEQETTALVVTQDNSITKLRKRKHLRFSYKLNKRIKVLLIKTYRLLPSFITGNYRRRINL